MPATTYRVTFDRLGRSRSPAPLEVRCPAATDADGKAPDELIDAILTYAHRHCGSRDLEVAATVAGDERGGPRGYVSAGVRLAGSFTLEVVVPDPSADATRYPSPNDGAGPFYGRGVWELGEDGDMGTVVQGHDQRAWAALSAYCRTLGISRPSRFLGGPAPAVALRWATFRDDCGCSDDEHAAHRQRINDDAENDREPADACDEITGNDDCRRLPPCELESCAWILEWHDPETPVPETAAPVLVWT